MDAVDDIDVGTSLSQFEYQRVQLDHSSAVARVSNQHHLQNAPADTSLQRVTKRIKSAQVARPAYFPLGAAIRRGLPPSQRHLAGVVQPNETESVVIIDNFTVLSVVVGLLPCKLVRTRGKEVRLASLLLADPSRCNVKLTLWDQKCDWLESKVAALEVGDIVIITGLSCSVWQGSVGLKTGWRSACACLHRQQHPLHALHAGDEGGALADTAFEAGQPPPAHSSGGGTSPAIPPFSESLRPYLAWFTGCDEGRAEAAQLQQWARQAYPALYRATSTGPAAQEGASLPALTQGSSAVVPLSGRLVTRTSDFVSRARGPDPPPPTQQQHGSAAGGQLASQYAAGLSSAPPFFTPSVTQASLVRAGSQWPSTGRHSLVSSTPPCNNITLLCTVLTVEEIAGPEAVYTVMLGAAAGVTSLRRVHVTCAPLGSPGQPLTVVVWCFASGPVRAGAVTRPVTQVVNAADPQRDALGDRALVSYRRLLASLHACAGTDEPVAVTHLSLGQSPFLAATTAPTAAGGSALGPAMVGPVLALHTGPATRVLRLPTATEIPVSWRNEVHRVLGSESAWAQHWVPLQDTPAPVLGQTKQPLQRSRLPLAVLPNRSSSAPSLPDDEQTPLHSSPRFTAASASSLPPVSKHVLVVQQSTLADAIAQCSVSVRQSPSPVHGLVLCCPARVSGWSMPTLCLGRQALPGGNGRAPTATAVPGMKAFLDYASSASPCGPSPLLCMRCAECAATLTPAQHAGITAPVYSCDACGPCPSMPVWQYVPVWLRLSSCPSLPPLSALSDTTSLPAAVDGQAGHGAAGSGSTTGCAPYSVWAQLSAGALHALLAAEDSGLSPDSLVQHASEGSAAGRVRGGRGVQQPPFTPGIDDTDTQPLEDSPPATAKGHDQLTTAVLDLLTSLLHPSNPAFTVILTGPSSMTGVGSTSTEEEPQHARPQLEGDSPHWSVLDITTAVG